MKKTPQQKKQESYEKDRRNIYGENSKSSRKNIPLQKRRRNRVERRTAREATRTDSTPVNENTVDAAAMRAIKKRKISWKKMPDVPLGKILQWKNRR